MCISPYGSHDTNTLLCFARDRRRHEIYVIKFIHSFVNAHTHTHMRCVFVSMRRRARSIFAHKLRRDLLSARRSSSSRSSSIITRVCRCGRRRRGRRRNRTRQLPECKLRNDRFDDYYTIDRCACTACDDEQRTIIGIECRVSAL